MAPLSEARVTPGRAFASTGIDFAGPFNVFASAGRGIRCKKEYVALFVCLSTKALHLELVGDMTTESFLGALTRFCCRRGCPREIWSDNGAYFRRADVEIHDRLHQAEIKLDLVAGALAEMGVKWSFIPPGAPHFGGLWEAGVKSVKGHLKRTVGPRNLTFEEFTTLLASTEMVLNNRLLNPLSGDPSDLEVLTPGHFLVGGPLVGLPEPDATTFNIDQSMHWKLVQALRGQFWQRWAREYLNTLQQRVKWTIPKRNLQVGDLVAVIDPSLLLPNGRWPLARVTEVHPSPDKFVRVVSVKTAIGCYKRPTEKLALVPLPEPNSSQPQELE